LLPPVEARSVKQLFVTPPPAASAPEPRIGRDGLLPALPLGAATRPSHVRQGRFVTTWLDSGVYNCQWHVAELALSALPPGSKITVATRTSATPESDVAVLASLGGVDAAGSWARSAPIRGPVQDDGSTSRPQADVLVLSGPGRYLQLMIELEGTGFDTPVISWIRLRFPRESLLEYLPAVYSMPEEQREFLDRLLALVQATWSTIEAEADSFERYLDPDAVPSKGFAFLARLLAVTLEGTWTEEQNRALLQAMPGLIAKWGTPAGLREWLRVYASVLGGLPVSSVPKDLPGIVEGFAERQALMLGRQGAARLCAGEGLWSPAVERRLQLGVFDREGEVELVSHGDPEVDLFRHHAHQFRVYMPAAWVRTPDQEALLRRAIDLQRPAHTAYELVLVAPRFRVGTQSIIDLDTVISAPPEGRLACAHAEDPPSQPARGRLGFDTVLGQGGDPSALESAELILA
jgi:phage tail-like protein